MSYQRSTISLYDECLAVLVESYLNSTTTTTEPAVKTTTDLLLLNNNTNTNVTITTTSSLNHTTTTASNLATTTTMNPTITLSIDNNVTTTTTTAAPDNQTVDNKVPTTNNNQTDSSLINNNNITTTTTQKNNLTTTVSTIQDHVPFSTSNLSDALMNHKNSSTYIRYYVKNNNNGTTSNTNTPYHSRLLLDTTATVTATTSSSLNNTTTTMNTLPNGTNHTTILVPANFYDNILLNPNVMNCIDRRLTTVTNYNNAVTTNINTWLIVLMGASVFFMQGGFAMMCAGCVRRKNIQNTMLKNILDSCIAAITFFAVGYAFAFGTADPNTITFIGLDQYFVGYKLQDFGYWFFQYTMCANCTTIVAGTLAERCTLVGYLLYSVFFTIFIYPIVVHSIWSMNGFLSAFASYPLFGIGVIDFAGSGVVHVTGGMTALLATTVIGPRAGRFYSSKGRPLKYPKIFPGSSPALQLLGTMMLWFGWYGFNSGSALFIKYAVNANTVGTVAARAGTNTSIAAGSGAITAMLTNVFWKKQKTGQYAFNLSMAMNGCLAGLVSITASCGIVEDWAAFVTGVIGGWIYVLGSALLIKLRLDDVVDGIPIHLFCGIWGMLATGLFASPQGMLEAYGTTDYVGFLYSVGQGTMNISLLTNQIIGIFFITSWTSLFMYPFFRQLHVMNIFRADTMAEVIGLDMQYGLNITYDKHVTTEIEEDVAAYQQEQLISSNISVKSNGKKKHPKSSSSSHHSTKTKQTIKSSSDTRSLVLT